MILLVKDTDPGPYIDGVRSILGVFVAGLMVAVTMANTKRIVGITKVRNIILLLPRKFRTRFSKRAYIWQRRRLRPWWLGGGTSWCDRGGTLLTLEVEPSSLIKLDLDPPSLTGETLAVLLLLKIIFSISSLLTIPKKISSKLGDEMEKEPEHTN